MFGALDFEDLEFWSFGALELCMFAAFEIWSFGALELWSFACLEFWILEIWSFGALELWSFACLEFWKFELVTLIFLSTLVNRRNRDGQLHAQHLLDERLPVHTAFVTASFVTSSSVAN